MRTKIVAVAAGLVAGLVAVSVWSPESGAAPAGLGSGTYETTLKPFLKQHCLDCHDKQSQKGGLDLESLKPEFTSREAEAVWTRVFDRVESGEMPPKKKPRPPEAAKHAALNWLSTTMTAADTARHQREGRTAIRRLNRTEYQNTIRDLLHVEVNVKDMLPEDGSAAGFDNVDDGLTLSSVLVERYLEAADAALTPCFTRVVDRPKTETKRYSFLNAPRTGHIRQTMGKQIKPLGNEAILFYSDNYPPKYIEESRVDHAGYYKIRIRCFAHNAGNRPLSILTYCGSQQEHQANTIFTGVFDVPAEPTTIEFTTFLDKRHTMKIVPYGMERKYFKEAKELEEWNGPAVAVNWVEFEGPIIDQWPPRCKADLVGDIDLTHGKYEQAVPIVKAFMPRAFRRPVSEAEMQPYLALMKTRFEAGYNFDDALKVALKAVLCSPQFLYLKPAPGKLDDYALASRLSYFLWSSMPDEQLMAVAASGKLHDPAMLRQQVDRMLKDPRSAAFTENFTGQWLKLREIDFTTPDKKLYFKFDELLKYSMLDETHAFFNEILKNDLSLLNFIDSDWAMLNQRLADHYGIKGVQGMSIHKVALPKDTHRGGVLTQGAVLKVTANGTNTSPVVRGVWVLDRIMGLPSPPPPKAVKAIEPDIRGAKTIREQLIKHQSEPACAVCHSRIDPPGYAMENFDPTGAWREQYAVLDEKKRKTKGPPVEASCTLADGRSFRNIDDFKQMLLADKDQVARSLAQKLLVYGTGHGLEFGDRASVEEIVAKAKTQNYGFRSLIQDVVASRTFGQR